MKFTRVHSAFLIALTVALEAEAEDYLGKLAVANVIVNRMEYTKKSAAHVVFKPWAFSAWNTAGGRQAAFAKISDVVWQDSEKAAISALYKIEPDPTKGADHYLNIPLTRKMRGGSLPGWVAKLKRTAVIGQHTFYKEVK